MKITFIALALEGIKLSKLHRSGRIISRINNSLFDTTSHIHVDMTGDQLFEWYNNLDETNQTIVDDLVLFLPEEEQYVIKDIYNIRVHHDTGFESERKMYQLVVAFLATAMVIVTLLTNMLYHFSAKQGRLVVPSNIVDALTSIYSEVSNHVSEHGVDSIADPSIDKSDGQINEEVVPEETLETPDTVPAE